MSNLLEKASVLLTPTAYEDGGVLSIKPSDGTGDFSFSRGSAGTRVNELGLIESMTTLSDELVQNGDFEQIGSELVTNGDFEQIGSELVPSIATISNLGGGSITQISGNSYSSTSDGTSGSAVRPKFDFSTTSGKTYKLVITPIGTVTGTVNFDFYDGSTYLFQNYDFTTTKEIYFKDNGSVFGAFDGTQTYSISNFTISIKEVGQNWTKVNATISDGKGNLNGDGQNSLLYQNILTQNKFYKVTFTVSDYNELGTARIINNDGSAYYTFTNNGTFTAYFKHTISSGNFIFQGVSGAVYSIDNVSVKEVGQNWTFGTDWSIEDGKLIGLGTSGFTTVDQFETVPLNKKCRVSFDILDYVSGEFRIPTFHWEDGRDEKYSGNGSYSIDVDFSNSADRFRFQSVQFNGAIDNISVIEITDDTDLPRINYKDGEGSLLLEPQSTNLVTYSEDLTQGVLNRTLITSNVGTSPDGTNTADKLIPNNTNSSYHYFAFSSLTIATNNVYSVFLKKAEYQYALISFETSGISGSSDKALINLNNGTIEQSDTETKVENYGNGWYRCSIKATSSRSSVAIYPLPSASLSSFTGDNASGVLAWGIQAEALSYATSYIPTNGSTVTRLADVCNNSGNSDLINSTEGVLYAEISALANYNTQRWLSLSDGTHSNAVKIGLLNSATDFRFAVEVRSANSTQAFMTYNFGAITPTMTKVAIKFKQNDFALWVNGTERATDTNGNAPTGLNELAFDRGDGGQDFEGNVKCVAVFKEALSDEELTCLTS